MKIPNGTLEVQGKEISLARIVSEDSQQRVRLSSIRTKSSKDS